MNISKENIDELNAVLQIQLVKEDYEEKVVNVLKDHRKKARIDGFRPGKVPFGIINKMYRKPVLVEEINKLVSDSLTKYLIDEKLDILGEPLPHKEESPKEINWDTDEEFEFKFDLGLSPEVDVTISAKDKVPFYNIKVDDDIIKKHIDNYTARMGEFLPVDVAEENDTLKADLAQLDENGNILEGGIQAEDSSLAISVIKDEKAKKEFIGKKAGEELIIDIKTAYPNDTEISSILKINKEEAAKVEGNYKITIKEVTRFTNAEVNQELFDKIYGEGAVKTEKEFKEKVAEEAKGGLKNDSEYKFRLDLKDSLLKKFKKDLPVEFLKRWLFEINQGKFSMEDIDKDFDSFESDLKWQLIKDKIAKENEIEVTQEELQEAAIGHARMQFMQYGMGNVPDEHLIGFADRILENKEEARKVRDQKFEDKVIEHLKGAVKVDEKDISADKFNKMFEK